VNSSLIYGERLAHAEAEGLLVLHHGRGSDERDLLPMADVLDPHRRLHVIAPRAPLTLSGGPGYHWYLVPEVGFPDPGTFRTAYETLAHFHDELWRRFALDAGRTVLGGFSMGSVMSYALGLGPDRPAPAGILAFSGFVPTVEGWAPQVPRDTAAFIAHGQEDMIMRVEFARTARHLLEDAHMDVDYRESDVGHTIDPRAIQPAMRWLNRVLP
jgi:phospholipase/carboxylesterase